jgi:peptidoglycan/LPS O-acetylase OafA/YrhL
MLQNDKQHYLALDSLRAICATLVVFYHFEGVTIIGSVPFVRNAFLFVDFFFVLSGFVIASSYAERVAAGLPIPKFMFLRLGRLYPLHAIVLLA